MKNYKVILGIAALALVFGLVLTGCPTQVEGNVGVNWTTPAQVGEIRVEKTTNSQYYIVSFDAVHEVSGYRVYLKSDGDGKQTISELTSSSNISGPTAGSKFDTATGVQQRNDNPEKWYVRISKNALPQIAGSYRIGVVTVPVRTYSNDIRESDIKWTETAPIILTAGPAVTITNASHTGYANTPATITVSWTGVPVDTTDIGYSVDLAVYYNGTAPTNSGGGDAQVAYNATQAANNGKTGSPNSGTVFNVPVNNPGTYKLRATMYSYNKKTGGGVWQDITTVQPEVWTSDLVVTNY
ncbi:hypothetical protein AGMMS49546_20900 [Spirochaetia bacterium]|nr:hypothetical protein AGMMS49546_20900 [Spirochaetia bacterium]